MSYQDLASGAALVEAPEQQAHIQNIANTLAQRTSRGGLFPIGGFLSMKPAT
jgi:hypothetical protein